MIVTSRYANKALTNERHLPVRASRGAPKFALPYRLEAACMAIAPPSSIRGITDLQEFGMAYADHLDGVGVEAISAELAALQQQAGDRDVVLLCFCQLEPHGLNCHRRLFASWWKGETGQTIPELATVESAQLF